MSPTEFEATKARIEEDVERARKAGDIVSLHAAATEQAILFSSYYRQPEYYEKSDQGSSWTMSPVPRQHRKVP
jgi:hypothetical protein